MLAPVMTFLTYVRRFTVSIAALAVSRHAVDPSTATVLRAVRRDRRRRGSTRPPRGSRCWGESDGGGRAVPEAPDSDAVKRRRSDPIIRARLTRL